MCPSLQPRSARFGVFEADLQKRVLRREGLRVKLQDQPFYVLAMLLEHPGELVSREDIRKRLWPADTFVEFDDGLNTAVKKLRAALADSADNPRFIETIPRRGYRFLAPVTIHAPEATEAEEISRPEPKTPLSLLSTATNPPTSSIAPSSTAKERHWIRRSPAAAIVVLALATAVGFILLSKTPFLSRRSFAHGKTTLIVIPLDNLSGDPQQEYFSDGITEEISTQLARLAPEQLGVIGRLTAMRYKHSGKDIAQIARDISVEYVLEGSVRREQSRVRVTVQLIEVAHQTHVWAEEYDRDFSDVLGMQREIATNIAGQIRLRLSPEQKSKLALGAPVKPEAHDAYLKGRYEWNKRTEDGFWSAIKYFDEASRIQPDYALAYAGLADSYNLLGQYGFARQSEMYPKAKADALKAVQLDATRAEVYTALADIEIKYDQNWSNAEADFQKAIQLDPAYTTAHLWYAEDYLTFAGKVQQAVVEVKRAQEIEPLSPLVGTVVAETFYLARDYDQAIREAQSVLELEPAFVPAFSRLGWSYAQKGMFPEATAEFQKGLAVSDRTFATAMKSELAQVYALSGRKADARKILDGLLQESRTRRVSPCQISVIYTALGENKLALDWLECCGQTENLPNLRADPRFDSMRKEPRFQDLVKRNGPKSE